MALSTTTGFLENKQTNILITHLSVLQIDLVPQHHKGEILRISRTGLDQELIPPAV